MSSDTDNADFLLTADEADNLLPSLSEDQITALAKLTSFVGTADGPIENLSLPSILQQASIVSESDEGYYVHFKGKRLEFSATIAPRSTWAWKNGPEGSLVLSHWKDDLLCPAGIMISHSDIGGKTIWKKTTVHDGKEWVTPIWENSFEKGKLRTFEYAGSGQPINEGARKFMVSAFEGIEKALASYARDELKLSFQRNSNGPSNKMFLFAKRPVVVHNAVPLDEGRASEYYDVFDAGKSIAEADCRFNRIPEVLVQDHQKKRDIPMSFHDVHLLGTQAIFQMIVTPRAYVHNKHLGWEFRLVTLKVLGKKRIEIASSPSKQVVKRKAIYIDVEEEAPDNSESSGKRARTVA